MYYVRIHVPRPIESSVRLFTGSDSLAGHLQTAIVHPLTLFSHFAAYKEKAFASLWAIGGVICAKDTPPALAPILANCRGVVLDVGPGAGHQVFRFSNADAITAIYGAEPGVSMHAALRRRAEQAGLGGKYHILNCEARLDSLVPTLAQEGLIEPGGMIFDEIVCIRVLCGVPDLDGVVEGLYSLLKPGGRMVVCEHVINSGDSKKGGTKIGRFMQKCYMRAGWSAMMGGCDLTRDTMVSLRKAAAKDGGWERVDIELCDPYSTIPHIVGVLVKKRDRS